ncbi:hypothetical protein C488_10016 [Natrinema pellirubrum DSM 15624]|uniref:Uncharacterized protein n=1 Tax=Natrinema pellirubrum (strain DSM 15624 / CIP 106293 / JCM 10476 / NCIMB 786 / 157) TaxID=797303 RepID=L0JQS9_NATP1|nr:hypothetical protein [Natrinema pellirubrum]AGB32977.1 hypothetical protein Natpe_3186 [Natrinema pellirubrum DSM 15624]ELY75081.1 hypothetical protein C488_10016 [Natrinema pellirubrum DSM 15624]
MTDADGSNVDRRTVLGALAGVGGAALAGCSAFERESDAETEQLDDDAARELAERFAPTLYFDSREPWFPTDPRPYESERNGDTVVDGFDALEGYHARASDGEPPNPTVFYHAVAYEDSPLAAVQFWSYSAFDQFTTNFHWHDWEVLHVFVDTETDEPQLYVASSHSRTVPNNEFLDPDPDAVPRVLSELGSHSSTLSVNDVPDRFQRVAVEDLLADITNTAIEGIEDLAEIPLAYGLPRDEGSRLPYVVPEYEGAPLYDHEDLPSVSRDSLIDAAVTVRSFDALTSPPTDLPARETGLVFDHRERAGDADVAYDLVPTADIEHITAFSGPQLRFEFAVPDAIEDAVAGHITATGIPWDQPRYENPAADISAPNHREALADRYDAIGDPAPINTVVSEITAAVTADDAPADEGLTTTATGVESVVLLESDPEAVPTFDGVAVVQDVPAGDHRLTANGAGTAPHSERVTVADDGATTAAGVDGEIPLVARERATKLEVGGEESDGELSRVALEDDFAGRLYESSVDGSDAVYVHDGGAYTTEVRDADDEIGAYRINPDAGAEEPVRIDRPETGTASLASFVAEIAAETQAAVAAVEPEGDTDDDDDDGSSNPVTGLERALAAVADAASRAAERARAGDRGNADEQLEAVRDRLERVGERLAAAEEDMPASLSRATEKRLEQADRRAEQARASETL